MDEMCRRRTHEAKIPVSSDVDGTTRAQMPRTARPWTMRSWRQGSWTPRAWTWWTAGGGRRTTSRWGKLTSGLIRCCAKPSARNTRRPGPCPLGDHTRTELYAHLNRAIRRDSQQMLFIARSRPWRPRGGRQRLAGGHLFGIYGHVVTTKPACPSCSGSSPTPAAFQPRRPGDPRFDQRRRRARLFARARVWVCLRQPGPDHRRRHR